MVRHQPTATLLEVRAEAIRWEREGLPGGARECSHSLPSMYGLQCGVQSSPHLALVLVSLLMWLDLFVSRKTDAH